MTSTSTSTWKFEHGGIKGFLSSQRASTDALKALEHWQACGTRRSYKVVAGEESEVELIAELSTDSNDSRAGIDLDSACAKYGITRTRA